jgi:hypothetical protein
LIERYPPHPFAALEVRTDTRTVRHAGPASDHGVATDRIHECFWATDGKPTR